MLIGYVAYKSYHDERFIQRAGSTYMLDYFNTYNKGGDPDAEVITPVPDDINQMKAEGTSEPTRGKDKSSRFRLTNPWASADWFSRSSSHGNNNTQPLAAADSTRRDSGPFGLDTEDVYQRPQKGGNRGSFIEESNPGFQHPQSTL